MNLNQLRYFIAVAENSSFSKAAEDCYISQTAITQQIKALEELLETELIDRSTRPISLTQAGKVFLIESRSILERTENAINRTKKVTAGAEGTLNIGYIKGYERSSLGNLLGDFHKAHPNLMLYFYREETDALASKLQKKEYDIIFTWDSSNIRHLPQFSYFLVEKVQLYLAMYRSHPLAQREYVTRRDLNGERMIFMSPSSSGDTMGDASYIKLYQNEGYQPDILMKTSDGETVLMMVAAEQAVSIVPEYCIDRFIYSDNLVFVPVQGIHEHEDIVAIWNTDNVSPALDSFLQHLGYLGESDGP